VKNADKFKIKFMDPEIRIDGRRIRHVLLDGIQVTEPGSITIEFYHDDRLPIKNDLIKLKKYNPQRTQYPTHDEIGSFRITLARGDVLDIDTNPVAMSLFKAIRKIINQ